MKCANPTCNHSIGLVSHRRGLFGKRPYCSKQCRDHLAVAPSAEVRTRHHLFRMAVHAAGYSAAENGDGGGSRQGAVREVASVVRIEQRRIRDGRKGRPRGDDFALLHPGYGL